MNITNLTVLFVYVKHISMLELCMFIMINEKKLAKYQAKKKKMLTSIYVNGPT